MGEAMDLAKEKMGLGSEKPPEKKEEGKKDSLSELEDAINKIENIEAKELLQAKARALKADLEARARESEDRARRYGGNGGSKELSEQGEKETKKQEILAHAILLIERGVDPIVVSRVIAESSSSNIPINFGGGQQGITISEVTQLFDMMNKTDRGDTELRSTVKSLNDTVAALSKQISEGGGNKGSRNLVEDMDATLDFIDKLENRGFMSRRNSGDTPGEPIENIKERNRHDERMEELKTEKNYKESMVDAVGNMVEDIGRGAASEVLRHKEVPAKKTGGVLETFECNNCHATVYVTPETGDTVKCAKCGTVFKRTLEEPK